MILFQKQGKLREFLRVGNTPISVGYAKSIFLGKIKDEQVEREKN